MGVIVVSSETGTLMYRDCPFCGCTHQSLYVDELEECVLACRDRIPPKDRDTLEAYEALLTRPAVN